MGVYGKEGKEEIGGREVGGAKIEKNPTGRKEFTPKRKRERGRKGILKEKNLWKNGQTSFPR